MEKNSPDIEEVKEWAKRLLDATHPLIVGPNTYKDTLFPRIVEASFRRDYLTLYTMLL